MTKSLVLALALLIPLSLNAEDCNTSCGDQCRVKIEPPRICSPWGGCVQIGGGAEFIEPQCNAKCEAFKKASCILGTPLPTVPLTPRETVQTVGGAVCTLPQQVTLQFISSRCNFISKNQAASDDALVGEAKALLLNAGVLAKSDFAGVNVSFCEVVAGGGGVAPDRDLVFLHTEWRKKARESQAKMIEFASLLAHEMTHVKQYRDWGTDKFKCDYARQMAECGLCQDERNSIERSAYEFQRSAQLKLASMYSVHVVPPAKPNPKR